MGSWLRFCGLLLIGCVAPAKEVKNVRRTVPLERDGRLVIDTYKGSVTIRSWENASVEIEARVEPDSGTDERDLRDTEVRIDPSPLSVRIKSDYSRVKRGWFWGINFTDNLPLVHYTIQMPRTARLEIKDYKSEIRVSELRSEVNINTYKGSTWISGLDGSLRFHTYKGGGRVHFQRLAGGSSIDTYKGEIEIELPANSGFQLASHIGRHGSLQSDFSPRRAKSGFGASVNGGGPILNLKTYRGAFRIRKA